MTAENDFHEFVEELQVFARRPLNFPNELREILELTSRHGEASAFREAIFQAKFAVKTRDVMTRIGEKGEGYEQLSTEFQKSLERTSVLLKTIVEHSDESYRASLAVKFLEMKRESFGNLLKLLEDLSWVKNWEVDGKPLPFRGTNHDSPLLAASHRTSRTIPDAHKREWAVRIRNGAVLGCVLMLCMLVVDPPVTFLGWSLAIIVILLFVSIAVMTLTLVKES